MDVDEFEQLFDWIIAGYKESPNLRPMQNDSNCVCGKPLEKGGIPLGYCKSHNIDCLSDFAEQVKIGAWSFKYLHEQLQIFALKYRDKINLQSPARTPSPPPTYQFTSMEQMDWHMPSRAITTYESSSPPMMCLPDYGNEQSSSILLKSLSQESFDFEDLMAG